MELFSSNLDLITLKLLLWSKKYEESSSLRLFYEFYMYFMALFLPYLKCFYDTALLMYTFESS